jgi:hypothetical protein
MTSAQQLLVLRGRDKDWSDGVHTFGEALIYRGLAHEKRLDPAVYAERSGASNRVIEYLAKADTPALSADSTANASFIDYLRNTSALDAMSRWMIPVAAHGAVAITAAAWTGNEVGEGLAKPVQTHTLNEGVISPLKTTALLAVTREFLQQPIRNVRGYIARAMRDAVSSAMNTAFFDDVEEANYGVANAASDDLAGVLVDLRELVKMVSYGENSKLFVFVSSDQAVHMSSLAMSVGNNDMGPQGGVFMGLEVKVSDNLPSGVIFCCDPTGVCWWDGGVQQSVSTVADLELEDAPSNASAPTVASAQLTSLFSTNSVGFRCERSFAYKVVRPGAIASLHGVAWGGSDSPA